MNDSDSRRAALPTADVEKSAEYWSTIEDDQFAAATYWLANPLVQQRFQKLACGGANYPHWVDCLIGQYMVDLCPVKRILSIGCGEGELERHLDRISAAECIDGIDIASGQIETARRMATEGGHESLDYRICNVERDPFPSASYDVIIFNSSLHHVAALEEVLEKTASHLTPGGLLFVVEYVGPDRLALTPREQEVLESVYRLIPPRFRVSLATGGRRKVLVKPANPSPREVKRVDPTEAVRSSEILTVVPEFFDVLDVRPIGGAILHWGLHNIAGNFQENDPRSRSFLELLFHIEDEMMAQGELSTHFALMVARKRDS